MSRWDERFERHPALPMVREATTLVEGFHPEGPESLESVARLKKVVSLVLSVADRVDAELVTSQMLDEVYSAATNLTAQLRAFEQNADAGHLENANANADLLLDAITRWPIPHTAEDLDGLRDRATSFRASVGQLLRRIDGEVDQVGQRVQELRATLEAIGEQAETQIESIREAGQARMEQANQRVSELGTTVENQKARLDQAIATFQQQFSDAEAQRSQRFETTAKEQRAEVTQFVQDLQERGEGGLGEFIEKAEETLEELRRKEEEARTLAVALGAIGVSGGHGQYAQEQKKSADFWRWVSVGSLLLLVGLAAAILVTLPDSGIQWERYVAKLLISGPLIALAGYSATQSAKHRRAERGARKVDLDLAALEPYLALFPPEKRDEIKEKIGMKVFGQPLEPDRQVDERIGTAQLLELIKSIQTK